MGVLRLLLASVVMMSHLTINIRGYNIGVMAVVLFYLLAGQVVVRLWARIRTQPDAVLVFARDRLMRIMPQYFAGIGLAIAVWSFAPTLEFLPAHPGVLDWLANLTVIPLNFFMYTGLDGLMLIPPAWSLAAELQFYLLTPLLFSLSETRLRWCAVASFGVFILAQFQILDSDNFGYRLLPGILFVFLLGSSFSENSVLHPRSHVQRAVSLLFWLGIGAYLLGLLAIGDHQHFRVEVAAGLFFGLPLIAFMRRQPSSKPWIKVVNRRAGELSYGMFLYHFPVIWTLQLWGLPHMGAEALPVILSSSLILAAIGHWFIERPLWRYLRPRFSV